ncbi:MAG: hypothetical protein KZQ99_14245 [Candidatus Thiodiazotropha sp. (ex Dulcina madagascariensis)]|nr:hypothetical protein [Candidatus Thiodiazotropha sp. (ex Dulcina madagascariensis)]
MAEPNLAYTVFRAPTMVQGKVRFVGNRKWGTLAPEAESAGNLEFIHLSLMKQDPPHRTPEYPFYFNMLQSFKSCINSQGSAYIQLNMKKTQRIDRLIPVAITTSLCLFAIPTKSVDACGWWGDGEMNRHNDLALTTPNGQSAAQSLTLQASKLPGRMGYGILGGVLNYLSERDSESFFVLARRDEA